MPLIFSVDIAIRALHGSDKRKATEFIIEAGYQIERLDKLLAESQENELRALRALEQAVRAPEDTGDG